MLSLAKTIGRVGLVFTKFNPTKTTRGRTEPTEKKVQQMTPIVPAQVAVSDDALMNRLRDEDFIPLQLISNRMRFGSTIASGIVLADLTLRAYKKWMSDPSDPKAMDVAKMAFRGKVCDFIHAEAKSFESRVDSVKARIRQARDELPQDWATIKPFVEDYVTVIQNAIDVGSHQAMANACEHFWSTIATAIDSIKRGVIPNDESVQLSADLATITFGLNMVKLMDILSAPEAIPYFASIAILDAFEAGVVPNGGYEQHETYINKLNADADAIIHRVVAWMSASSEQVANKELSKPQEDTLNMIFSKLVESGGKVGKRISRLIKSASKAHHRIEVLDAVFDVISIYQKEVLKKESVDTKAIRDSLPVDLPEDVKKVVSLLDSIIAADKTKANDAVATLKKEASDDRQKLNQQIVELKNLIGKYSEEASIMVGNLKEADNKIQAITEAKKALQKQLNEERELASRDLEEFGRLKREYEEASKSFPEMAERNAALNDEVRKLKRTIKKLAKKVALSEKVASQSATKLGSTETKLGVVSEELRETKANASAVLAMNDTLRSKNEKLDNELLTLQQQLEAASKSEEETRALLDSVKKASEEALANAELTKGRADELSQQVAVRSARISELEAKVNEQDARLADLEQTRQKFDRLITALNEFDPSPAAPEVKIAKAFNGLRDISQRLEQSVLLIAEKDKLLEESAMKVRVYEEQHTKDTAEWGSMLKRMTQIKRDSENATKKYDELRASKLALEQQLVELRASSAEADTIAQEKIIALVRKVEESAAQMANQKRIIARLEGETQKTKNALAAEVEQRKSIEQLDEKRLRLIDLVSKDTTVLSDLTQFATDIKTIPNPSHQSALTSLYTKMLPIFAVARPFRTAVSSTVAKMEKGFKVVFINERLSQDEAMNLVAEPIVDGFAELSQIVTGLVTETTLIPLKILKLFNDARASGPILKVLEQAINLTAAITQGIASLTISPALTRPLMWTLAACMLIASVNTKVPEYTSGSRMMVTLSIRYMLADCVEILQYIKDNDEKLLKDTKSSVDKAVKTPLATKCLALIHAAKNAVQEYREFQSEIFGIKAQPLLLQVFETDSREHELFTQSMEVALQ